MKILHICTEDYGGAGKATLRLHFGLKSIGADSKVLVLRRKFRDSSVVRFSQSGHLLKYAKCAWDKLNDGWILTKFKIYGSYLLRGEDPFTYDRTEYTVSRHPLVREADIIDLRWIAGMVDYGEFFSNLRNKPIAWRLDDMNPFTGGCHYSHGCTKYESGCGSCFQLGSKDPNDISRRIFKRKEKAYRGHHIHIVTPSQWLTECAKNSQLFKDFKVEVIPYGIPVSLFVKRNRQYCRDILNLPQDKILILFGAEYKAERKGFKWLIQALKLLKKKVDVSKIALVTFGPRWFMPAFFKELGFSVYQLGYIQDETRLSCVYSAADMFIIPSVEDNLPNTMLESMACSTPVVAFSAGGIIDVIEPYQTGLLAEVKNVEELAEKIEWMINHPDRRQEIGENGRRLIEQKYTLQIQAKRYLDFLGGLY